MIDTIPGWFGLDTTVAPDNVVFMLFGQHSSSLFGKEGKLRPHDMADEVLRHREKYFIVGHTEDGIYPADLPSSKYKGKYLPGPNSFFAKHIAMCDLLTCTYRGCVPLFEQYGAKAVRWVGPSVESRYLQDDIVGSNARWREEPYLWDVIFIGNYFPKDPRYMDRPNIVPFIHDYCKQQDIRFQIFGQGWAKELGAKRIPENKLHEKIWDAKLCFALNRNTLDIPWWDFCFSDTLFKAMACPRTVALADLDPKADFNHVLWFSGLEALCGLIQEWRRRPTRMAMAEQQAMDVREQWTREVRAKTIELAIKEHIPCGLPS